MNCFAAAMLAAHAAKICIVENQVAELRTLLNEIGLRKALDLVVKAVKMMSSLSTTPESLQLSIRSKSLPSRKFLSISIHSYSRALKFPEKS